VTIKLYNLETKIMKNYSILLSLFFISLLFSCTADSVDESDRNASSFFPSKFTDATNFVFINTNGAHNMFTNYGNIQTDFEDSFIPFEINGIEITEDFIDEQEKRIPFRTGKNENLMFLGDLGTTVVIKVASVSSEVYIPKFVDVSSENFINHDLKISKSNGIVINWVVDVNNPNEDVFLALLNRGFRSSEGPKPSAVISDMVKDENGSYTISPDSLEGFEIGHVVDFYIGRGNEILKGDTAFIFYNINLIGGTIVE